MTPKKDNSKTAGRPSDVNPQKYDVGYMQRTRDFYSAQGYSNHYQWAKNSNAPFTTLQQTTQRLQSCGYYYGDARYKTGQNSAWRLSAAK